MFTKRKGSLFIPIIIIILAVVSVISQKHESKPEFTPDGEIMVVRFMDVGQGDCEVIQLSDGRNIIIDGGKNEGADELVKDIKTLGIKRFDYLIATHPHEDHIGGLDAIVKSFDIGEVYMPYAHSNSKTFEDFANAVSNKDIKVSAASAGVVMIDEPDIRAEFLAPVSGAYEDTNNYSAVLKLTYGEKAFLFTGDAEAKSELEMIKNGADLKADVLKVGHHGSGTSTNGAFLKRVNPEIAVIEVGADNEYGHPHDKILQRLQYKTVYRTDLHGTVTVECDGVTVNAYTEKEDVND